MFKYIRRKLGEARQKSLERKCATMEKAAKQANLQSLTGELVELASDGRLTQKELELIRHRQAELRLSDEETKSAKLAAYATAFKEATKDGILTEDEENELNSIQRELAISDEAIVANRKALARYRLVREIQNGNLPVIEVSGMALKKGEQVHWVEPSILIEERVISRHYEGGYRGASFRIMKGVTYRVGGFRGYPVVHTGNVAVSEGDLVLTNKRAVFRGDRKSFAASLDKILNFELYANAIQLSESNRSKSRLIQFRDTENTDIVGSIITYVLNHCQAK